MERHTHSAVEFPGDARIHLALAVADLEQSERFYRTLFGARPSKERPGYVKFEPADPSLNLTLNQVSGRRPAPLLPAHFGIQVKSTAAVEQAVGRFREAGLKNRVEEGTTCCYAVQDKVWVEDPDGNRWEVFVVLQSDADQQAASGDACCEEDCCEEEACCEERVAAG